MRSHARLLFHPLAVRKSADIFLRQTVEAFGLPFRLSLSEHGRYLPAPVVGWKNARVSNTDLLSGLTMPIFKMVMEHGVHVFKVHEKAELPGVSDLRHARHLTCGPVWLAFHIIWLRMCRFLLSLRPMFVLPRPGVAENPVTLLPRLSRVDCQVWGAYALLRPDNPQAVVFIAMLTASPTLLIFNVTHALRVGNWRKVSGSAPGILVICSRQPPTKDRVKKKKIEEPQENHRKNTTFCVFRKPMADSSTS